MKDPSRSMARSRRPAWRVALPYVAFFAATNWPLLAVANRIEPRVGPFPLLVAWMLGWSLAISLYHAVWMLRAAAAEPPAGEGGES